MLNPREETAQYYGSVTALLQMKIIAENNLKNLQKKLPDLKDGEGQEMIDKMGGWLAIHGFAVHELSKLEDPKYMDLFKEMYPYANLQKLKDDCEKEVQEMVKQRDDLLSQN